MVAVAQLVESRIVIPVVVGSSPISHPTFLPLCFFLLRAMNKAFVRESDADDEDERAEGSAPLPAGTRNYITPTGYRRLKDELVQLLNVERPQVVQTVSWAASNGDRSENGDYIYGKKRLREIDRRIRFLTKRLDLAEVVDPAARTEATDQVFFGATVRYADTQGSEHEIQIVGVDEANVSKGKISFVSPLAKAMINKRAGDKAVQKNADKNRVYEILDISYS